MSFDFGSSAPESDPTADFLARERAAAGALSGDAELFGASAGGAASGDKDFSSGASAFPALDGDDSAPPSATAASAPAPDFGSFGDDDDLLGGGAPSGSAPPPQQQLDERDQFAQNFPDLAEPEPEPVVQQTNGHMAPPIASNISRPAPSASYGIAAADPYANDSSEEPEAVREWRARQADDIARRDAEAERKKAETVSKAERDIDQFYAEYNQKKEKNIAANKEAEAKFHASRQAELAEGTTWARVTKLVDLQNSQSKTTARGGPGASDLTRYKEILLSLRREGDTAPAAAGY